MPALERATACRDAPLAYLIAHTSDTDWRVRAAAYEALSKIVPIDNMPLRDTPIDERETVMLGWLDSHGPVLSADLCEVYARSDNLRFGRTLVQRCMPCHTGPDPVPALADSRCAVCHEDIHSQWAGSAHANSLTHMRLITIDPDTRQQAALEFTGQLGMSCVGCHEPEIKTTSLPVDIADGIGCLASFKTSGCGSCHTQAQAQWQVWRDSPRYQHVDWPPGSIERATGEPQSCTACHMSDGDHRWAARRDTGLLQSGIRLTVSREAEGRAVLMLRNLAGHAYPTGTTRRALRLYAQTDDGPETLVATLTEQLPGQDETQIYQRPLSPNEQRSFTLPGRPARVRARLIYVRNRFRQEGYAVEVTSVER